MPKVKTPKLYNLREQINIGSIILAWVIVSLIIINTIENQTYMKVTLFIAFIIMVPLLFWQGLRIKRSFICPDCKTPIPETVKTSGEPGEPIMHYCKKCDTLWHTGNVPSS
jgi:hypothetical protein